MAQKKKEYKSKEYKFKEYKSEEYKSKDKIYIPLPSLNYAPKNEYILPIDWLTPGSIQINLKQCPPNYAYKKLKYKS